MVYWLWLSYRSYAECAGGVKAVDGGEIIPLSSELADDAHSPEKLTGYYEFSTGKPLCYRQDFQRIISGVSWPTLLSPDIFYFTTPQSFVSHFFQYDFCKLI